MSDNEPKALQQALFERDKERLDAAEFILRAVKASDFMSIFELGYYAGVNAGIEIARDINNKAMLEWKSRAT